MPPTPPAPTLVQVALRYIPAAPQQMTVRASITLNGAASSALPVLLTGSGQVRTWLRAPPALEHAATHSRKLQQFPPCSSGPARSMVTACALWEWPALHRQLSAVVRPPLALDAGAVH